MVIADIITEFGAYYLNHGQNLSRLYKLLNHPPTTMSLFTPVVTNDTEWRASSASVTRLIQPFQKQYTPTGEATFTPVEIKQFKIKVDTQEYPDDLESTWLGFLAGQGLDRKEWPFVRYFIEQLMIPKMLEDLEMNEVYAGVRAEPTAGTPGAAGTAMDGLKVIINRHITANRTTPIPTGALSATPLTFLNQLETFVDAIDKRYWNAEMPMLMGQHLYRRALRGYREKYGLQNDFQGERDALRLSNVRLVGVPSMNLTEKIVVTPVSNVVRLMKRASGLNVPRIENVDRLVKVYTDFYAGLGFILPEIIFTNDRDLAA